MAESDSPGSQDPHLLLLSHSDREIRSQAWEKWLQDGNEAKIRKSIRWWIRKCYLNQDAEDDIFVETIIELMISLSENRFDPRRSTLTTYASAIAANLAKRMAYNETKAGVNFNEDGANEEGEEICDETALSVAEAFEEKAELSHKLKTAYSSMKQKEWKAIVLQHAHGLSGKEAARRMNITPGHLRILVHRGTQSASRALSAD